MPDEALGEGALLPTRERNDLSSSFRRSTQQNILAKYSVKIMTFVATLSSI